MSIYDRIQSNKKRNWWITGAVLVGVMFAINPFAAGFILILVGPVILFSQIGSIFLPTFIVALVGTGLLLVDSVYSNDPNIDYHLGAILLFYAAIFPFAYFFHKAYTNRWLHVLFLVVFFLLIQSKHFFDFIKIDWVFAYLLYPLVIMEVILLARRYFSRKS